jgi:hypothetical protein
MDAADVVRHTLDHGGIMRRSSIALVAAMLALGAALSFADPAVRVESIDGVANVVLVGEYPRSRYTVFRAAESTGPWVPVTSFDVLCLDRCIAADPAALAGQSYWYRFDLSSATGEAVSYGPYLVSIPATLGRELGLRVWPNPGRGPATVELHMGGGASAGPRRADVLVLDLQGRVVRVLLEGELPPGFSRISWDGLDRDGRELGAGVWFVVARTPLGTVRTRWTRLR